MVYAPSLAQTKTQKCGLQQSIRKCWTSAGLKECPRVIDKEAVVVEVDRFSAQYDFGVFISYEVSRKQLQIQIQVTT